MKAENIVCRRWTLFRQGGLREVFFSVRMSIVRVVRQQFSIAGYMAVS